MSTLVFETEKEVPNPVLTVGENNKASFITFHGGQHEILKITEDGFYVRGKRVEADEQEARAVYKAFKEFLVYSALSR